MSRPFVSQEPAELSYCQDCAQHYWTDTGHDCGAKPDTPLELALVLLCVVGIVGALAWLLSRT